MLMRLLMMMLMLVQATEVASAAKRAQAHETPGRGDMLPRFEVSGLGGVLGFFERLHYMYLRSANLPLH